MMIGHDHSIMVSASHVVVRQRGLVVAQVCVFAEIGNNIRKKVVAIAERNLHGIGEVARGVVSDVQSHEIGLGMSEPYG